MNKPSRRTMRVHGDSTQKDLMASFIMQNPLDDVFVDKPVAICEHPLDNIYADMLHRSGLKCESTEEMVGFLQAMMEAHDAVKARLSVEDMDTATLRATIRENLANGESIIDVACDMGYPIYEVVNVLTNNHAHPAVYWDEVDWANAEDALMSGRSQQSIADELGISKQNVATMQGWYRS